MADRYATKDGDWSDVSVWDGGASLPGVGDVVRPNGFVVTIDQDVTVAELRSDASGPAAIKGSFILSSGAELTSDIYSSQSIGTVGLVNINAAGGVFVINGNLVNAASGSHTPVMLNPTSTGALLTVNGNITAGVSWMGIYTRASGTIIVNGNLVGAAQAAMYVIGAYLVRVNGNITAGTSFTGLYGHSGNSVFILNGNLYSGPTGITPYSLPASGRVFFEPNAAIEWAAFDSITGVPSAARSLYSSNNPDGFDPPLEGDVREGTVFNNTDSTGTLAVPDPSLVAEGVPTDATVGTMKAARLQRATAVPAFPFVMKSTTGAPLPGLTVTAERSLDGAAFSACENAPAEVGNGVYTLDLATTDLDGDTVVLRFTASGAAEVAALIVTG